jgi:UDP-2,3-diacylglucosamine hydrolase
MKAYFLSDLHLGAPYFEDSHKSEKRVVDFLDSIKEDADVIYLLGDILDYWYEYRYVVPRGYVRFFGKLAELTDRGIRIVWFIGNHDIWIYDYIPNELGVEVVDGYRVENINGKNFFLTHGDGVGKLKPSFKLIRTIFRNKFCQKLYSSLNPRWTVPFAYRWSDHSRKKGGPTPEMADWMLKNITAFSKEYLQSHPDIDYFVYGHLHIVRDLPLEEKARILVLGEWISQFTYAVWDGSTLQLLKYTPRCD